MKKMKFQLLTATYLLASTLCMGQTGTFSDIGIGTTTPVAKLDIHAGTSTIDGIRLYKDIDASRNWLSFSQGNGTNTFRLGQITWSNGLALHKGGTDPTNPGDIIQKWDPDGKVGIGTVSPRSRLEVNGVLTVSPNQSAYMAVGAYSTSDNFAYYSYSAAVNGTGLKFETSDGPNANWGLTRMTITNTGNVGIGTTTPQAKLAVNGDIFARKVTVTTAGWSDYVFERGYKLPTLSEIEKFIFTHKHLPGIPSAVEVEKDGIDLGTNQALLLEKIEQLMLYVIQLNKKIEALESDTKSKK